MQREIINIVRDTPWLSHAIIAIDGEVVAEVLEVRTGTWKPESMEYLMAAGSRLDSLGFRFQTAPSLAESWIRIEFKKVNQQKEIS